MAIFTQTLWPIMVEKFALGTVLIIFIFAFALRNIKTYVNTKESIKGKSTKLSLSIVLSTLIYISIFLRIIILEEKQFLEFDIIQPNILDYVGYSLICLGFIIGSLSLLTMKNSWRVGIKYDQKTDLVTNGIYKISRNPYFLSYDLLILGYIFVFPSIILIVLYLPLIFIFHSMILEEEKYLSSVHTKEYLKYKNSVNRYLTIPGLKK